MKKKWKRRDYVCATINFVLSGAEVEPEEGTPGCKLLTILDEPGQLVPTTQKAAVALGLAARANPFSGVFRRGNQLVEPVRVADEAELNSHGVRRGRLAIVPVEAAGVRFALAEACHWQCYDSRSKVRVPINPPMEVAKTLLALAPKWSSIPILTGVVESPVLRPDGSILDRPGHYPQTGLLFDPGEVEFPPVPTAPSRKQALAALDTVLEVLAEFAFKGKASRSVAVSGLMAPMLRYACPIVPLHLYTAGMMVRVMQRASDFSGSSMLS